MMVRMLLGGAAAVLGLGLSLQAAATENVSAPVVCLDAQPVGVIVDTDLGSSTDDLFVLATVKGLEYLHRGKLLAVMLDRACAATDDTDCFRVFAEAFLHASGYNWDDVPIGTVPQLPPGVEANRVFVPYAELSFATEKWSEPLLPRPASRTGIVTNAVTLYRMILSQAPDNSVEICAVGFMTNLVALLESPSDDLSSSTGRELIASKVRALRIMAGCFDGSLAHAEYNVAGDVPSASKIFGSWPGKIIVSPYEVGSRVYLPQSKVNKAAAGDVSNPIALTYAHWDPDGDRPKSQLMWDALTTLGMVVDGFRYRGPGLVSIDTKGYTTFTETEKGNVYIQELTESSYGTFLRDVLQELACGRTTPDPAESNAVRICAVGSTNVVDRGFIIVRNASTNDFDLTGCAMTCGPLECAATASYAFPSGTVLRAGSALRLDGATCWPDGAVPEGGLNVLLWTPDRDVLHDTLVNSDWFKDDAPADGFLASREDKGLMVDRADWSVGCGSGHFTAENGVQAKIRMDEAGLPVVEPADGSSSVSVTSWGAPGLLGFWMTPAERTKDRFFRLTK